MENKAFYYSHRFGKKYHLGRSMIEMLGVLAIIGVLSIGGLYAYRQAMIRHRGNELIDFISKVHLASHELCLNSDKCLLAFDEDNPNHFSDTNRRLCKSGLLPVEACHSVGAFTYFKEGYAVGRSGAWRIVGYGERITLGLFIIPKSICERLIDYPLEHLKAFQFEEGNTYEKLSDGSYTHNGIPVDASVLKNECTEKDNFMLHWN